MDEYPTTPSRSVSLSREIAQYSRYTKSSSDVQGILDDLAAIKEIDKKAEQSQTGAFLLAAASIIGGIIFCNVYSDLTLLGVIVTVMLAVGFFSAFAQNMKLNVEDERYLVTQKLLQMLSRDILPNEPLDVDIDFKPVWEEANFSRHVIGGRFFRLNWLNIKGQFIDETRFEIKITELYKIKNRKNKHRHKGYRIDLRLRLSDERYSVTHHVLESIRTGNQPSPAAEDAPRGIRRLAGGGRVSPGIPANLACYAAIFKLPQGTAPKALAIKGRNMVVSARKAPKAFGESAETTATELYKSTTAMVLTAYHVLNLARKIKSAS